MCIAKEKEKHIIKQIFLFPFYICYQWCMSSAHTSPTVALVGSCHHLSTNLPVYCSLVQLYMIMRALSLSYNVHLLCSTDAKHIRSLSVIGLFFTAALLWTCSPGSSTTSTCNDQPAFILVLCNQEQRPDAGTHVCLSLYLYWFSLSIYLYVFFITALPSNKHIQQQHLWPSHLAALKSRIWMHCQQPCRQMNLCLCQMKKDLSL